MVEGGGLENRYSGFPRIVGSNPTLSAIFYCRLVFFIELGDFVYLYPTLGIIALCEKSTSFLWAMAMSGKHF